MLVTGQELLRAEPDGPMVRHADLSGVAGHGWNEIVVDGRGNIYLNGFGFNFLGGEPPTPGSSRWSPRTARPARSRATWRSRTAWW